MLEQAKTLTQRFKTELNVYRLVLVHPCTPRLSKILLGAAIGYFLSPIDLIPDFVPVLGQLDDLLIVPALLLAALKFVPADVVAECRRQAGA
ncbi:MAG: DUF1232 domain-containing protein [Anaerolineae bacterium]|nr:DUF1232 domain-containing protein [Anaerolineae bacterium]